MIYRFVLIVGCITGCIFSALAHAAISIEPYAKQEFNPSSGQVFELPVKITVPGIITIAFYTADGDLARTVVTDSKDQAGIYTIRWDGKDTNNRIVPNEAYIPVVTLNTETTAHHYDPRETSGGEVIDISPAINSEGQITFQLQQPSRILARAGIKSGPLLKTLLHWQVRGSGRNVIFWNGYDQDNLIQLVGNDQLALLVTGFELADHAILTTGNNTDYHRWRQEKGWPSSMPDLSEAVFERDGRRISRHYYLPRSVDIEPRVTLNIVDQLTKNQPPKNKEGIAIVSGPILLRVEMHDDDRWAMQQSLYEVAFFLNNQFLSEEEQGYVPLTWRWSPVGVAPGIRIITVNVSGFNGQVGVRSLAVEIPKIEAHNERN